MLILLPPSEGKAAPGDGPAVELSQLTFAGHLTTPRQKLIAALEKLGSVPEPRALEALGISAGQAGDIERDAVLATAPAAPAADVYTGVLYDRLDFAGLGPKASKRAGGHVLISSALWGFVRPADSIPYYRFSMKARLPRIGAPASFWRPHLAAAMDSSGLDREGDLILDMRSGAYSAAWKPKHAVLLPVKAFTEAAGTRKAVSHMAKATRGDVARAVLEAGSMPVDPEGVAGLLEAAGYRVELPGSSLDVIVDS
jgi:cytoplasmic iron level regulating protein YaaA (DUF328/UPF0246 family)